MSAPSPPPFSPALPPQPQALAGVRVVEMGQLIAGPFVGKTLGEFGAEVIKIEPPLNGDPLRQWRVIERDERLNLLVVDDPVRCACVEGTSNHVLMM